MSLTGSTETKQLLMGEIHQLNKVYGYSAYDLAVQNGFEGDLDEWLESLKGSKGDPGNVEVGDVTAEDISDKFLDYVYEGWTLNHITVKKFGKVISGNVGFGTTEESPMFILGGVKDEYAPPLDTYGLGEMYDRSTIPLEGTIAVNISSNLTAVGDIPSECKNIAFSFTYICK